MFRSENIYYKHEDMKFSELLFLTVHRVFANTHFPTTFTTQSYDEHTIYYIFRIFYLKEQARTIKRMSHCNV